MSSNTSFAETSSGGMSLEVGSAILMEASTGQVLYSYNENEALPPASMSKMMTEYLVLDAIKSGAISWDETVVTSENAATTLPAGSRIFLAEGDRHTVEDLYIAMAIASANDATVALAEFVAGTEENFAHRMNEKAREIGLSEHAHFINSTGLNREHMVEKYRPTSIPGETLMTAKDAAILAVHILRDHPVMTDYSSIPYYQFRERDATPMENLNQMLEVWEEYNNFYTRTAYPGLDGFKTGYTVEAGYCFTGTAERDGMRLVTVVMNTDTRDKRFEETRKLMDYGFNNFEKRTIIPAKSEIDVLHTLPVTKGLEHEVSVVTEEGLEMMVRIEDTDENFSLEAVAVDEEHLEAPIQQGEILGTLTVTYDGYEKAEYTIHLVATDDVERAGWFRLFFRAIGDFFSSIFSGFGGSSE